jgi:hypothetical protein
MAVEEALSAHQMGKVAVWPRQYNYAIAAFLVQFCLDRFKALN